MSSVRGAWFIGFRRPSQVCAVTRSTRSSPWHRGRGEASTGPGGRQVRSVIAVWGAGSMVRSQSRQMRLLECCTCFRGRDLVFPLKRSLVFPLKRPLVFPLKRPRWFR